MTTSIDEFMDLQPPLPRDKVRALVEYYRNQRGAAKPKKEAGPTQELKLEDLGFVKQVPNFRRR